MEFLILGPMEALDGTRPLPLPAGRGRALLALLVLHAGETVPADRLVDALWEENPPPTAGTALQGLVSKLRKIIEPGRTGTRGGVLQTHGGGYRLAIDPDAVDANRFKRLIDEARDAAPATRAQALTSALALWRGPALADFTYMPFAQRAISALDELRIAAIEDRVEAELELERSRELIPELEGLVREHPFRERLQGFLMLALYRAGRQIEALEAYRTAREVLVSEIGVEPGPALRDLEAAILRQDPALVPGPISRPADTARHAGAVEPGASWLPRERRPVTVLALDLTPAGAERADAEAVEHAVRRAVQVATATLERHGARVERVLGATIMALFGFPAAHEDDVLRAARSAVDVRTAIGGLDDEPGPAGIFAPWSRIAVESGEVVAQGPGASFHDLAGPVITTAARLQQAAGEGAIVVGPEARRLLRGAAILKAADAPDAWQLLEVLPDAQAIPRALEAPMFGRQDEMTRLRAAFRHAVRTDAPVRVAVVGEAGIGKSRLAGELVASLGSDAHAITIRCPAYGAVFPMRQAMVEAAGLTGWRALHDLLAVGHDGDRLPPEIAAAIGMPADRSSAEALFLALHRLLATLAAARPLVAVLEDLHWADPAFLELIDRLADERHARILLLCLGRPELIEARPAWNAGDAVHLESLPSEDIERMLMERARSASRAAISGIAATSQGNPLFAEQLLAAAEEGAADPVPASLIGLLTMRLDRLGPAERDLLRCASVVGMEFDARLVSALLPEPARPFVGAHLETLERRHLIARGDGARMRFRHVLIQLTAYQSMTHQDRALLHERLADWLEPGAPGMEPELRDIVEYHRGRVAEHRARSGIPPSHR